MSKKPAAVAESEQNASSMSKTIPAVAESVQNASGMNEQPPTVEQNSSGTSEKPPEVAECEKNVMFALNNSPIVRLLIGALNKAGCEFIPHRHISCDLDCQGNLSGGYDNRMCQAVICAKQCSSESSVTRVLAHELVHMYDHCTKNTDFYRRDHLACTEIRAANLIECNRFRGFFRRDQSNCVAHKASDSVKAIKGISFDEALLEVQAVFKKCYNDLEPIGRRPFDCEDELKAFWEFQHFNQ